ncbi:MAG: hypothetical protein ACLPHP_08875 [Candidatus Sulfotelmatobacter sp.]
MTLRKSILLLIASTTIAALVGCSSSTPPITLSLNSVPTSLAVNSQTALVAAVDNDKANGGVVWSCTTTPSGSPCGTFNPATTASGASTTYIAPAILLPAGTTITITATSATNSAISQSSQPITITAATLASGNYVFSVTGWDYNDESPFTVSGVIKIAGGAVTGEQDFTDYNFQLQDTISATGSSVTVAADGNLAITLATGDDNIGVGGVETFTGSVLPLNPGKASIAEFDASATGSGGLELQSASLTAIPGPGSYAFVLGGLDSYPTGDPIAVGGIVNIDDLPGTSGGPPTVGTISGAGSVFDVNDSFFSGTGAGLSFSSSSVSGPIGAPGAPDSFGRVTFTMNSPDLPAQLVLAGYLVSSSKIQLVETADNYEGALAGVAFAQTVPTGGFTAANATNTYVIGMQGADTFNFILQSAEQLAIAADGSVTGFLDYADFSVENASPDPVSAPTASAVVDPTGRVSISGVTDDATVPLIYNIQLYLDGNGHALAITLDNTDVQAGPGFQQSGASSIAASSFSGAYSMGVTGVDGNVDGPFDSVGPVVADGSSSFAGFGDVNWLDYFDPGPIVVSDNPTSGTFSSNANGIFSGTITGIDIVNCPAFTPTTEGTCTPDAFNFYLVDQYGDNIAIETDGNQLTFGYFIQQ